MTKKYSSKEAEQAVKQTLSANSDLAYIVRRINAMGQPKPEEGEAAPPPAPPPPAARRTASALRPEPVANQYLHTIEQPEPIHTKPDPQVLNSVKQEPHVINEIKPPAPAKAADQVDPRLVEIARLWASLSEKDKQELHLLTKLKVHLSGTVNRP